MKKDSITRLAEIAIMSEKSLTRRQRWALIKVRLVQLLGGLIMEKDEDGTLVVSLGRVSWWIVFLPAVAIWIASGGKLNAGEALRDISPNHFNMLVVLAGYNFSKKLTDTARLFVGNRKSGMSQTNFPNRPTIPQQIGQTNENGEMNPKPPSNRWDS